MAVRGRAKLKESKFQICVLCALFWLTLLFASAPQTFAQGGIPLWTNRYDGPGNGYDGAAAVAVDNSGNVFATGKSVGSSGSFDYATIKYSGLGVALWTNRYAGGSGGAAAAAVDSSGNVFVTGFSSDDYATVAYSSAGVALWTNRYNGPADSYDYATAVAVDSSGNVFVTGVSSGSSSVVDYATIAYSSAGVALWTNRYDGPANHFDYAYAIAVDGSGNVFVTGGSWRSSSDSDYDYATVAYSGAGVALWTNRYNGPANRDDFANAMAVDSSGNVFVTGESRGGPSSDGCATVAYSNAGVALWTNRSDGAIGRAVVVDTSGNVFVTGTATIAYSSAGVALWTNRSGGSYARVAVDGSGNVFVAGSSNGSLSSDDYATIAYSSAGVALWTNHYNGPADGYDDATAVGVDSSGNVFVTGVSYNGSSHDYATIAYSSAGVALWTNRYDGPAISYDFSNGVAVDRSGNVFVTGPSIGGYSGHATVAYSSAGVALWTNRYDGPADSYGYATAVAVDSSGNVLVTGSSFSGFSSDAYATIAYSSAGVALWTNRYDGPANLHDYGHAVAVDSSGNVFVTGASDDSIGLSDDYATIAYSSAGVARWTNRYDGPANSSDSASAIVVDSGGNVFVTGASVDGPGYSDYATIAYSSAGVARWTNRYDGPANSYDSASAIAVDSGGNVFVTGSSSNGTNDDYVTIAYSSAGVALWTNRYDGPVNSSDSASAIAVDSGGNVFVTGTSQGSSSYFDYATVAYSGAGVALWTNRYSGPTTNSFDSASAVSVDSSGNVFVTGVSAGDFVTIKYSSSLSPRLSIDRDGSGGLFIRHTGVPDVTYRLQRAASLTGPWSDLATNSTPASGLIEYHETSPPPTQAFYRTVRP